MDYFLGEYDYAIDDGNRLSIPSKLRKVMTQWGQNNFKVSKEQQNHLILFPSDFWNERVGSKVLNLPLSDPRAHRLRRLIGLNITEVSMDSQGRINIPADYYQHVGIEKKIKIIGSVDIIQLWNPDIYAKVSQTSEERSLLEELAEFKI